MQTQLKNKNTLKASSEAAEGMVAGKIISVYILSHMFLFFNHRSHIFLSDHSIPHCMSNKPDEIALCEKKKGEMPLTEPWLLEQQEQQKRDRQAKHYPRCIRCGSPIDTDWALCLEGDWYCQRCIRRCTREVEKE